MSLEVPYLLGDGPRFVVRNWEEVAPAVKAFMFIAPCILLAWIAISVRRGAIAFYVSHLSVHKPNDIDPFASSWCMSNKALAAIRLGFGCWCLYVFKWMGDHSNPNSFQGQQGLSAFYTCWNYAILTALALMLGTYTLRKVFVHTPPTARGDCYRAFLWTVYQQQLPAALLVSFVFWAVVYPNQQPADRRGLFHVASSNMHFWNSVYMVFELCCNEIPVHFPHAVFVLFLSFVYMFYGVFVKGFIPSIAHLDLAKDSTAVVFAGILAFHLVLYTIVFHVAKRKLHWLERKRGGDRTRVHEKHAHVDDTMEQGSLKAPLLEHAAAS
eukprot:GDKI01044465.1.p1 GENE.GDKI01044465.1~~GDKI01044465.1.p1  ORF type:complete len:325 (-),score=62.38 GDKI01044465.1:306-1280(-)